MTLNGVKRREIKMVLTYLRYFLQVTNKAILIKSVK